MTPLEKLGHTPVRSVPVTEPIYVLPLILITGLFFLWALSVNGNDVLIPPLKRAFRLTNFRSSFNQTAFFGGYSIAALPVGWLMERIGYKKGLLLGPVGCAIGAALFYPAASIRLCGFFNSIMFPAIVALSLKDLGPYIKRESSLLVLAIIGAAAFPPVMGFISDRTNIQTSFLIPVICYAVVFYFAVWGFKPSAVEGIVEPVAAEN